jgi:hypothetical protein
MVPNPGAGGRADSTWSAGLFRSALDHALLRRVAPTSGTRLRFEAWAEIERAVERATAYWNQHKHPFIFIASGIALVRSIVMQPFLALRARRSPGLSGTQR